MIETQEEERKRLIDDFRNYASDAYDAIIEDEPSYFDNRSLEDLRNDRIYVHVPIRKLFWS